MTERVSKVIVQHFCQIQTSTSISPQLLMVLNVRALISELVPNLIGKDPYMVPMET